MVFVCSIKNVSDGGATGCDRVLDTKKAVFTSARGWRGNVMTSLYVHPSVSRMTQKVIRIFL